MWIKKELNSSHSCLILPISCPSRKIFCNTTLMKLVTNSKKQHYSKSITRLWDQQRAYRLARFFARFFKKNTHLNSQRNSINYQELPLFFSPLISSYARFFAKITGKNHPLFPIYRSQRWMAKACAQPVSILPRLSGPLFETEGLSRWDFLWIIISNFTPLPSPNWRRGRW